MTANTSRRQYLRLLAAGGTLNLTGCSTFSSEMPGTETEPDPESENTPTEDDGGENPTPPSTRTNAGKERSPTPTSTRTRTPTITPTKTPTSEGEVPPKVTDWLSDVNNYDGSIVDKTGQSEVTIEMGAEGNDGNFAFEPPATRIDNNTIVIWNDIDEDWVHSLNFVEGFDTAEGTHHSEEDPDLEKVTFNSAGIILYSCAPHEALNEKGAIIVE